MTNADVIRALSDEGLAYYIEHHGGCPPDITNNCGWMEMSCEECWLKWLQKEARVEEYGK